MIEPTFPECSLCGVGAEEECVMGPEQGCNEPPVMHCGGCCLAGARNEVCHQPCLACEVETVEVFESLAEALGEHFPDARVEYRGARDNAWAWNE